MSAAANNWLKDRPLLTVLFSFLSSLILLFTARAVNFNDERDKEIEYEMDKKASIEMVERYHEAAISYTDQSIVNHEKIDAARYENITDMFKAIRDEQSEMRADIKELLKNAN